VVFSLKGICARISEFSLRGMLRIIFTPFLIFDDHDLTFFSRWCSFKGISAHISEFRLCGILCISITSFMSYFMVLPFCLGGVQLEGDQCVHLWFSLRSMLHI
jgi:hypothetical protein